MRGPRRLVLDDHQPFQCLHVLGGGARLEGRPGPANVPGQRGHRRRRGDVSGQRPQQPSHLDGVSSLVFQPLNLDALYLRQVVAVCPHGLRQAAALVAGPAPGAHQLRQLLHRDVRTRRPLRATRQQASQRHLARGAPRLEERHRTHPQPRQTPGAGVAGDIVRGHCRTGEDELAGNASPVHGPSDVVPDRRFRLPLVDEARRFACKDGRRVQVDHGSGSVVHIQEHGAGRDRFGRRSLPAGLGTLDHDRAGGGKPVGQLGVDNSGKVLHDEELRAPLSATQGPPKNPGEGSAKIQGKIRRKSRGIIGEDSGEDSARCVQYLAPMPFTKSQGKDIRLRRNNRRSRQSPKEIPMARAARTMSPSGGTILRARVASAKGTALMSGGS